MGADNQAEKVIDRIERLERAQAEIERLTPLADGGKLLGDLRRDGWRVGVHNDYQLDGELRTFWLLTHPAGVYVKGEAQTDLGALRICALAASKIFAPSP